MKKGTAIMLIITGVFIFTVLGIFIGRSTRDGILQIHTRSSVRSETVNEDDSVALGLININTASIELLQELPGIGEATATEIINYREEKGPFERKRDLMKVKGIGEKTYEELKSMITVKDDE